MKKFKKLFLSFAVAALAAVAAIGFISCKKTPKKDPDPGWGEEETVSVRFETGVAEVYQYETVQLAVSVTGTSEKPVFSSSDESAVSVDQSGLVTAKGVIGTTVITAAAGGKTATCEVSVKRSPYAPVIRVESDFYRLEEGGSVSFDAQTLWNNVPVAEAVEYGWSLAEGSENAKTVFSISGNVITVTASDTAESAEMILYTTFRGIYTAKKISVQVVKSSYGLYPVSGAFTPSEGRYSAKVSTISDVGELSDVLGLDFVLRKGETVYDDAVISWNVGGDCAQIVDGNTVKGLKKGSTLVTGTVVYDGETVSTEVELTVVAPKVKLSETTVIDVSNLQPYTVTGDLIGTVTDAEYAGQTVSASVSGKTITFDKEKFPKKAALLGNGVLTVNTEVVSYLMDVEVYTMIIRSKADLDKMASEANTGETEFSNRQQKIVNSQRYDGYFILGNDIDYNGTITSMTDTGKVFLIQSNWADMSRGFGGIFDGRGYNIKGVTASRNTSGTSESGGIFGYITKDGIIRNVSFTEATILASNGFICSMGEGLIENVSISYKKICGDKPTVNINSDPRKAGSFFTFKAGSEARVRNCLIDASAAEITLETGTVFGKTVYSIALCGSATDVEHAVAVCSHPTVLANSGADVKKTSLKELSYDTAVTEAFDSDKWSTVSGILIFKRLADNLDVNQPVNFIGLEDELWVSFPVNIVVDNPYSEITISEVDGVTYSGGVLSAEEIAAGQTVTVTATSLFNPSIKAEKDVTVVGFGVLVEFPGSDEVFVVNRSNPVLDLGEYSGSLGTSTQLYIGKNEIGGGTTVITVDPLKIDRWEPTEVTVVTLKNGRKERFYINVSFEYTYQMATGTEQAADDIFGTYLGPTSDPIIKNVTLESGVTPPDGFTSVRKYESGSWGKGKTLSTGCFDRTELSEYSELWFAVKVVNVRWVVFGNYKVTGEWVFFHLIRRSDEEWQVSMFIGGELFASDVVSGKRKSSEQPKNAIATLLYREGWGNGFLLNRINTDGEAYVYCTEIRGKKA